MPPSNHFDSWMAHRQQTAKTFLKWFYHSVNRLYTDPWKQLQGFHCKQLFTMWHDYMFLKQMGQELKEITDVICGIICSKVSAIFFSKIFKYADLKKNILLQNKG